MPLGFTRFGAPLVAAGLKGEGRLVLAVWDTAGAGKAEIPLAGLGALSVKTGYPKNYAPACELSGEILSLRFGKVHSAVLEIEIAK